MSVLNAIVYRSKKHTRFGIIQSISAASIPSSTSFLVLSSLLGTFEDKRPFKNLMFFLQRINLLCNSIRDPPHFLNFIFSQTSCCLRLSFGFD